MGKSDLNHTNEKGALGKQKKPLSLHNVQSCRGPKSLLNATTEGGLVTGGERGGGGGGRCLAKRDRQPVIVSDIKGHQ